MTTTDNEAGMLAHIDDLEDTNRMLLEALNLTHSYTNHTSFCECVKGGPECTCGLLDADTKVKAAIAKAEGK